MLSNPFHRPSTYDPNLSLSSAMSAATNFVSGGTTASKKLSKPVVIPALSTDVSSSFIRAYPPDLAKMDVSRENFLKFIDELGQMAKPNTPLTILSAAGDIVSMVPEPTCQIVGTILGPVAEDAAEDMAKKKTKIFLESANRELWEPRGLHAKVVRLPTVALVAGIPIIDQERKDKVRIDKYVTILPPLDLEELQLQKPGSQSLEEETDQYLTARSMRRLEALEEWIAPLDIEQALPQEKKEKQGDFRKRWDRWEREQTENRTLKKRKEMMEKFAEKRHKAEEKHQKQLRELADKEARIAEKEAKKGKPREEDRAELEKKRTKVQEEYDERMEKLGNDQHKGDKEEKKIREIKMLLICNMDDMGQFPPKDDY